jgi:diguanylate cyclase (GGDEF)-like protein/PAS domain S-box-containing protein
LKLVQKVWLGIGITLLATLAGMVLVGYQHSRRSVEAALLEEGRTLRDALMAVRRTYQHQFIDSGIAIDETTVGFLPAHAMPRISEAFNEFDRRGVRFNNVSDHARNPANQADAIELEAIRHYRANPTATERLVTYTEASGQRYFHYSTPIWTEPYCLTCHGDPKDAPPTIRKQYRTAWGYKVGDLRGILSVKLPARATEDRILGLWWREQALHLGVVALALLVAGGLMHVLVVRRLNAFRLGAHQIAAGDLGWRIADHGADEASDLARSLNEMAATIQRNQEDMRLAASVFSNAFDGIIITDDKGRILDANPAFSRITGYPREEVLGRNPSLLASGRHDRNFYARMWHEIQDHGVWTGEVWNRRKNGETYPERLAITAVSDPHRRVTHYVGMFTDISLLKRQEEQLVYLAQHDALTGIPNRALLADRMRQAIAHARRSGELLAVCYLDLDGFKPVNDSLGHEAGDRALVTMAQRMQRALRGGDTVARLGGDEFVLLLRGLRSVAECETSLDRQLEAIAEPLVLDDNSVRLSASIGVSLYPNDDEDPDTLLRHADQAMYTAKQSGRNRYHFYDLEGDRRARGRRESQARIRQGLEAGEFELHYQPRVNMRTGAVVGAEALARWRHPERGLLPPADFLPEIENSEVDLALGRWVLEQATGQLSAWRASGLGLGVSVNISAHHIQQADFLDQLAALLARHPDLAPGALELEILETAALEDLGHVSEVIRTCKRLGSDFSLDDFGTGYSSLTYLKHLPVQSLKIDQSFVRDMLRDPDDLAIVEGVIALAEAFGRDVVAEGVDSLESGLLLLQLGCQYAQGYSIAHPMPADRMSGWVADWRAPDAWREDDFRYWRKEDFALLLAAHNHREWIDNLVDRIAGGDGHHEPLLLDPESCRFGRWYQGSGQVRYGGLAEFRALDDVHHRVHRLGGELVALLRAGNTDEAKRRLPELFALRDDLLSRLDALQARVLDDSHAVTPD